MTNRRLCILGAGNMGRALIGGLLRSGTPAAQLSVAESQAAACEAVARDFGISATNDNAAALAGASLAAMRPLLISVAAGVRIAALESWCGAGVPVMRAMPNRPARFGAGATGVYAPPAIGHEQRVAAERVLKALGDVFWVRAEELLDVVTALSGSGPAYFFLLAELMAEAGTELGLESTMAQRLAVATLYGAGLLARAGDADLARLRAEVTSAGGTTEAALRAFAAADLRATVRAALAAATQRGRELALQTTS